MPKPVTETIEDTPYLSVIRDRHIIKAASNRRLFPPVGPAEKGPGRIELRRLARVATTPEDLGLTGCWQVLAGERLRHPANGSRVKPTLEIAYYATATRIK